MDYQKRFKTFKLRYHKKGGTTGAANNGLNQLTSIGGGATNHDALGNLTLDPMTGKSFIYDSQSRLTAVSGCAGARTSELALG